MKLSASNIAWAKEQDEKVYGMMQNLGFTGLEIAPTRWFPENPYEHVKEAKEYAKMLKKMYGFSISSMQSIWYGRTERIVDSEENRKQLLAYTEKAVRFADAIDCQNLVFGCPRNRSVDSPEQREIVVDFLADAAHIAEKYGIVIALEANPTIYNTNFANTTFEAIDIVKRIDRPSLKLNLDFGTIIENGENLNKIFDDAPIFHHVHISEPMLRPIQQRVEHRLMQRKLEKEKYDGYISLEMKKTGNDMCLELIMEYLNQTSIKKEIKQ